MIFAAINAGHYLIIEDDRVVADILRKVVSAGPSCPRRWTRKYYEVHWKPEFQFTRPSQAFKTLPDIHNEFKFDNYAAYGKVLKRR